MKTHRTTHTAKARPFSICTSTIATAAMVISQVSSFAPSAFAETFTTPFGTQAASGILAGPDLTMNGGGLLLLAPGQSYAGTTTINDGSVSITAASALGAGGSTIVIDGPPINAVNFQATVGAGGGNLTVGGGIAVGRDFFLRGFGSTGLTGALTSVGSNTFTGSITTGTGAATRIFSTSGLATFSGPITIGAGQNIQIGGNSGNMLISGSTTATNGQIIKNLGSGLVELTGTNLHSGGTRVDAGFLRVSNEAALGTNTGANAMQLNGGTFELRTNNTGGDGWVGDKNVGATASATLFLDHAVGGTAINQTISLRALTQTVNTTLTMNGRDGYGASFFSYTSSGANNSTVTNNLNGLVTIGGGTSGTFWNQTDGTSRTLTITATGDILVNGNVTVGTANSAHNIAKAGAGTLTLIATGTGANFTGTTSVTAGTLAINSITALNNAAVGTASGINLSGGTLSLTGAGAAADYNIAKTVNLNGAGAGTINANQTSAVPAVISAYAATGSGNKTLTLGGTNTQDNLVSAAITDSTNAVPGVVSLTKTGIGTWALSGANTYTGNTTISGGTLKLLANGANTPVIGGGTATIFNTNGGTLELVGAAATANTQTLGQLTPNAGAATIKLTPGAGGSMAATFATGTNGTGLATVNNASSVNFVASGVGNTVTIASQPDGFIDPHITYNGANYAIATGGTGLLDAPVYGTTPGFSTSAVALTTGDHNEITGSFTTTGVGTSDTIRSLKINGTQTLTLAGRLTINSQGLTTGATSAGGILQTGGTGTITGGNISTGTAGNLAIRVDGGGDVLNLVSPIQATSGGLTKNGAGLLVLSGANAQSGQTTINEGTLQLAGTGVLSAANVNMVINRLGTLDMNGVSTGTRIAALNGDGTIINSAGGAVTLTVGNNAGTGTFSGTIQEGAGVITVIKQSTGAQTWSGSNTYSGTTTINSTGVVSVPILADGGVNSGIGKSSNAATSLVFNGSGSATGGNAGLSYTGAASVSIDRNFTLDGSAANGGGRIQANGANNAALVFNNTGAIAVTGTGTKLLTLGGASSADNTMRLQIVDGAGNATVGIWKTDAGLWILDPTSANTYTRATTIQNGMLQAQDGVGLSAGSNLTIGSGTSGAATAIFQSSGNFTRALGAGAGQVQLVGTGTATSTNNMGFAASTAKLNVTFGGGTATWGTANFMPAGAAGQAFLLNSTTALSEVDIQAAMDLNGGTREIQVLDNGATASDFATISGLISGGSGSNLLKTGAGQLNLTNAGNSYAGDTTVRQGVLAVTSLGNNIGIGNSNVGAWGAGAVNLGFNATNGILDYVGAGETSSRTINATGTSGATTTIRSNGTGALSLSGVTNTASGTAGRTIALGGENTGPNEISNVLTDNGGPLSITKQDGGVWIANAANTYSGATSVNAGALGIGADASGPVNAPTSGPLGVGTLILNNGSIMALNGDRTISNLVSLNNANIGFMGDNSINIASTATVTTSSGLNNFLPAGKTLTFSGTVTNDATARSLTFQGSGDSIITGQVTNGTGGPLSLALNATGGGTLKLSNGTNNYQGPTTLTTGTLIVDAVGAISTAGTGGAVLNLNGGILQATSDANGVVSNVTLVGGNPTISGTSTVEFTNSFTNSAGNRVVTNNIAGIGKELKLSGPVFLSENTTQRTLTLTGTGNTTVNGVIQNGGTAVVGGFSLVKQGTGTLNVNQVNTYTGTTTINNGIVNMNGNSAGVVGLGTAIALNANLVGQSATLNVNGDGLLTNGLTMSGTTGATGNVAIAAAGTLGVTAVNYNVAGGTTNSLGSLISGGQLGLLVTGTAATARTFTVADSTAAADDLTVSSLIVKTGTGSGAAALTKAGAGRLVLTNTANTYTGATSINAGILNVAALADGGIASSIGMSSASAGNLVVGNTGTLEYTGSTAQSTNRLFTIGAGTSGATIDASGSNPAATLNFTGTGAYSVAAGTAGKTLILAGSNTGLNTLSGIIPTTGTASPLNLTKTGLGTWQLLGLNTYNGNTTIQNGLLTVGPSGSLGTIGTVTVLAGGKLGGTGNLGRIVTNTGGEISPGNSIGTASGVSLDMTAGGTFKLEINTTLITNDRLNLSGALTLGGLASVLTVTDLNTTALALNSKLAFITYSTETGLFSVNGNVVRDHDQFPTDFFTVGANNFGINYDDTATLPGFNSVSLVAVPEPGTIGSLIGGFGVLLGLRRRRQSRRA